MSCRLLVEADALAAGPLDVEGDDYHYLFRVRRLRAGDALVLFDGAGREADAEVESVGAERARLRVGEVRSAAPATKPRLVVLQSLVKGDRMEGCISRLVELGVDEIVPVQAARSVVVLRGRRAEERQERYRRVAAAAARQCRRATVPVIGPVTDLERALEATAEVPLKLLLWEGARAIPLRSALPEGPIEAMALLVGPEGGLTDEEVERAREAGFTPVGLGPRILRADTAPVAAAAIVGYVFGDLSGPATDGP